VCEKLSNAAVAVNSIKNFYDTGVVTQCNLLSVTGHIEREARSF
jgi:hypothetical protein